VARPPRSAREIDHEDAVREDAHRAEFVRDLWDAYHDIKGIRRALKAAGLREAVEQPTSEQNEALQKQKPRLDAAQLTLEKLFRTVKQEQGRAFSERPKNLVASST
jgi:DNA-binding transcriptional MerR regulator